MLAWCCLNCYLFIYAKSTYKNKQLLLFYIFSLTTLLARTVFYIIVMIESLKTSDSKLSAGTWVVINDLPNYTYLLTAVCQLLIVVELIICYNLKREYNEIEAIHVIHKIKQARLWVYLMFCVLCCLTLLAFLGDLSVKAAICRHEYSKEINSTWPQAADISLYVLVVVTLAVASIYQIVQFRNLDSHAFRETNFRLALIMVAYNLSFSVYIAVSALEIRD